MFKRFKAWVHDRLMIRAMARQAYTQGLKSPITRTEYCYPHLNKLVGEFLYRYCKGEVYASSTDVHVITGQYWQVSSYDKMPNVKVRCNGEALKIVVKNFAAIHIDHYRQPIETHSGTLTIDWSTPVRHNDQEAHQQLCWLMNDLLAASKYPSNQGKDMNNESRGLSAGELLELTNSTRSFWQRISKGAIPGIIYPDSRQGIEVKFDAEGSVGISNERRFTFTRLLDKARFQLTFDVGPDPDSVSKVKVGYDQRQFNPLAIIIMISEALKSDEYIIGGTGQKVINGVGQPMQETTTTIEAEVKRVVGNFLDQAPLVSTTNFNAHPTRFALGHDYIVGILRSEVGVTLYLYRTEGKLLAKIGYQLMQPEAFVEFSEADGKFEELLNAFNFVKHPPVFLEAQDDPANYTDALTWVRIFKALLKTTGDDFAGGQVLWQDQAGFANFSEIRTCGYIRRIGTTNTLELTIRYEGEKSHAHNGKVILQYNINNGLVIRMDRDNDVLLQLGVYFINNYLHNTPPVNKGVLEEQRTKPTRDLISESYRLLTNMDFFKNVRKGVVPKDVRTALGYSLYLTRLSDSSDYAPVKVEVFAGNDVKNPFVFFQATYALDGGVYYEPGRYFEVNLEKYLELVEAIVEQEKKNWQFANSLSTPAASQPHQHDYVALEPQLLNDAGDDISDEWVAWHVRTHNSSLGKAVKAGLDKMHQLRNQFDNIINHYGK